jgi:heme/copper-type cytochrome/quinol oxidase subunit 3
VTATRSKENALEDHENDDDDEDFVCNPPPIIHVDSTWKQPSPTSQQQQQTAPPSNPTGRLITLLICVIASSLYLAAAVSKVLTVSDDDDDEQPQQHSPMPLDKMLLLSASIGFLIFGLFELILLQKRRCRLVLSGTMILGSIFMMTSAIWNCTGRLNEDEGDDSHQSQHNEYISNIFLSVSVHIFALRASISLLYGHCNYDRFNPYDSSNFYHDQESNYCRCCCVSWKFVADVFFLIGTLTDIVVSYSYILGSAEATKKSMSYVSIGAACCWVISSLLHFDVLPWKQPLAFHSGLENDADNTGTVDTTVLDPGEFATTKNDPGDQSYLSCGWTPPNMDTICGVSPSGNVVTAKGNSNHNGEAIRPGALKYTTSSNRYQHQLQQQQQQQMDYQLDDCIRASFFCGTEQ